MNTNTHLPQAAEYQLAYKKTLDCLQPFSSDSTKLEIQVESLRDWNLFHDLQSQEIWFENKRKNCPMSVQAIPLKDLKGWKISEETGNVTHEGGDFFTVHGLRVSSSEMREVGKAGWDQPILTQVGFDGGILGIIKKRFSGVPHYLLEAKAEPGNYKLVQISPTLQATFSNLRRAHSGRKPHFAEYFETPELMHAKILYSAWLSEDGGRLFNKRNKAILVEVEENHALEFNEDFRWFSLYQIKRFLHKDAWINPHVRGIIAHL